MLTYEVHKRELIGRELHLHVRNPGRVRMPKDFDVSGSRVGPSSAQVHNMVQHDGYVEAIVVGSLYGFHCAVQRYNNRQALAEPSGAPGTAPPHDYVTLVHRTGKITEYGIAIGSTCPDYSLFYHVGDQVLQLQDPNNHVWMYFRTEKSDRLYVDVGSLSYGMGLMLNIIGYLPEDTAESHVQHLTPTLGAPAGVLDRSEVALIDRELTVATAAVRKGYLADRTRIPLSDLPMDATPDVTIRSLLERVRQAAVTGAPPPPQPESSETRGPASPRPGSSSSATLMGVVAAAAMVTAAAANLAEDPSGTSGRGSSGGSGSGGSRGGSGGGGVERSKGGPGGSGGSGPVPAAAAAAAGSGSKARIPFRDGTLERHVTKAMLHFECAYSNTYAVLDQATYKRYPPNLDLARCFASWVDVGALEKKPTRTQARSGRGAAVGRRS